jgi:hypothetical protein
MSCTSYEGIWGSGGIATFILNRGARLICQRHAPDVCPARLASPVAISNQSCYECHVSGTNANTQCIRMFHCCHQWHSQLHSCQHMKLNRLLSSPSRASVITCWHEQYKKELKIVLRRCIATSTVLSMGALELRHQLQTSVPLAVLRSASHFQNSSTRQRENICYSKAGHKIANGRSRWELRSSGLLCS